MHITMVSGLSAGWISGKKLQFGSAPGAGCGGGDISDSGWHGSGSVCLPHSVTFIDSSQSMLWEKDRMEDAAFGNLEDKQKQSKTFWRWKGAFDEKKRWKVELKQSIFIEDGQLNTFFLFCWVHLLYCSLMNKKNAICQNSIHAIKSCAQTCVYTLPDKVKFKMQTIISNKRGIPRPKPISTSLISAPAPTNFLENRELKKTLSYTFPYINVMNFFLFQTYPIYCRLSLNKPYCECVFCLVFCWCGFEKAPPHQKQNWATTTFHMNVQNIRLDWAQTSVKISGLFIFCL